MLVHRSSARLMTAPSHLKCIAVASEMTPYLQVGDFLGGEKIKLLRHEYILVFNKDTGRCVAYELMVPQRYSDTSIESKVFEHGQKMYEYQAVLVFGNVFLFRAKHVETCLRKRMLKLEFEFEHDGEIRSYETRWDDE